MKNSFTIINNRTNESFEFDILDATRGPSVVDISTFYAKTKMFTYDPGFTSTASCISDITFIDGEKGELRYRGIEISELASNNSYLDVCYLLLNSKLPNKEESKDFDLELRHRSFLHEGLKTYLKLSHPMPILWLLSLPLHLHYHHFIMTI